MAVMFAMFCGVVMLSALALGWDRARRGLSEQPNRIVALLGGIFGGVFVLGGVVDLIWNWH